MTTIFGLIRHGLTDWNLEKRIQGRRDIPLNRQGRCQAGIWCARLKDQGFDRVLSSPLKRARETGQIIARYLGKELFLDPGFAEQDFGLWEGVRLKDIKKKFPSAVRDQEEKGWQFCPPGGEIRTALIQRAFQALDRANQTFPGEKLLVVTHNSLLKSLIYRLLDKDFLPGDPAILLPCHLHLVVTTPKSSVVQLNALDLDPDKTSLENFRSLP
ncbi:MAG: histidine phosphatase family protein [Proteobacteria bacterium]|nr:histidine phosphatase family protein [Pseudomonadota bacterium]